ncbi:MAG: triose-phosphate isomerase [Planctomycetota bacterium]|nr:MAG: triose-phosphate isomerase [Planctomycetota bacterium]
MTRTPVIAGNWKMHLTRRKASALARAVAAHHAGAVHRRCILFPAFVHLDHVRRNIRGSGVVLGAQNCWGKKEGAFTGEISPYMLRDMGVEVVLLGHSERRHILGETDALLTDKLKVALRAKLEVLLCVGETRSEREEGRTLDVVKRQLRILRFVKDHQIPRVGVAYEPVWAIGTGLTATPAQAQEAHAAIRETVARILGDEAAENLPVLYGGSVKPGNAAELLSQPDVDGALVGGASLSIDQFGPILDAAPIA